MIRRFRKRLPLTLLRRIAPIWIACLVAGSLLPGEAKVAIGSSRLSDQHLEEQSIQTGEWKHRAFHIAGFGATALLLLVIARTGVEEFAYMVGVFGLGIAIECTQMFLFQNRLETEDIRDDGYGIAIVYAAWLLLALIERWKAEKSAGRTVSNH